MDLRSRVDEALRFSKLSQFIDRVSVREVGEKEVVVVVPYDVVEQITGVRVGLKIRIRRTRSTASKFLNVEGRIITKYGTLKTFTRYISSYDSLPRSIDSLLENVSDETTRKLLSLIYNGERYGFKIDTERRVLRREGITIHYDVHYPSGAVTADIRIVYRACIKIPRSVLENLITECFRRHDVRPDTYVDIRVDDADADRGCWTYVIEVGLPRYRSIEAPAMSVDIYESIKELEAAAREKRAAQLDDVELGVLASALLVLGDGVSRYLHSIYRETGRTPRKILEHAEERFGVKSVSGLLEKLGAGLDPETPTIVVGGKPIVAYLEKYFGPDANDVAREITEAYILQRYGGYEDPFEKMEEDGVLTPSTARIVARRASAPLPALARVWRMLDPETRREVLQRRSAYELVELWRISRELAEEVLLHS